MLLYRLFFLIVLSTTSLLNAANTDNMNAIAEQAVVEVLFGKEVASQMEGGSTDLSLEK